MKISEKVRQLEEQNEAKEKALALAEDAGSETEV